MHLIPVHTHQSHVGVHTSHTGVHATRWPTHHTRSCDHTHRPAEGLPLRLEGKGADLAPDSCVLFVVSDTCCDFQAASVPSAGEWGYSWPRPPRLIGVWPAACACRPAPYLHPNSRALPASSRPLPICAAVTLVALHPSLSHNGPHGGAGACECLWGPCVLPSSPDRAET